MPGVDRWVVRNDLAIDQLGDGSLVVYDGDTDETHALNCTGGAILECFREPASIDDAVKKIVQEWQVEPEMTDAALRKIVAAYVEELAKRRLLVQYNHNTM